MEALLEESRIKLSSVITDLWGITGYRILKAPAKGETDPAKLTAMAADNLKSSPEQLAKGDERTDAEPPSKGVGDATGGTGPVGQAQSPN
jgi:hypothetical protein